MSTTLNPGGSSQEILDKLMLERAAPGADTEDIDARIWKTFGEDWAVMFTDLSGFSRRVADFGIIHFLQIIYDSKRIFMPCIEQHDGIILMEEGDSLMIIFRDVHDAVACAIAMQRGAADHNRGRTAEEEVIPCLGIGYGRMLKIGDTDVFGAEVNAASKLGEDIAGPREILVTGNVYDQIKDNPAYGFEALPAAPSGADSAYRLLYKLQ